MLAVLVNKIDVVRLFPRLRAPDLLWLLAAFLVTVLGVILSALRWQRVLTALGRPTRLPQLVSHSFAGLFVGNFLPSTIGGDVLRVSRLSASNGDTPGSFASVVLERLTGWVVLPLLTLSAITVNSRLLRTPHWDLLPVIAISTLALLTILLTATGSRWVGERLQGNESWLRFVGAVHLGIDRFRRQPAAVAEVLTVGLVYQATVVLSVFLAAKALGVPVSWSVALAVIPVVAILQVLPISIGGLGVREGALVLFLAHVQLGVRAEEAIALGLLFYGLNLAASLLGAPAFAVGVKPAQVRA
jgi:hypothetical protein